MQFGSLTEHLVNPEYSYIRLSFVGSSGFLRFSQPTLLLEAKKKKSSQVHTICLTHIAMLSCKIFLNRMSFELNGNLFHLILCWTILSISNSRKFSPISTEKKNSDLAFRVDKGPFSGKEHL